MHGWKRAGRGSRARLVATLDRQEVAVLRGLVGEVLRMLDARTDEHPHDELAELTGMVAGPSTKPADPVLARLLPDFATDDSSLSGALRELHEPELIAAKRQGEHRRLGVDPGLPGPERILADTERLREQLREAKATTGLPAQPTANDALHDLIVRARLAAR